MPSFRGMKPCRCEVRRDRAVAAAPSNLVCLSMVTERSIALPCALTPVRWGRQPPTSSPETLEVGPVPISHWPAIPSRDGWQVRGVSLTGRELVFWRRLSAIPPVMLQSCWLGTPRLMRFRLRFPPEAMQGLPQAQPLRYSTSQQVRVGGILRVVHNCQRAGA